jgi:hypothetical protein
MNGKKGCACLSCYGKNRINMETDSLVEIDPELGRVLWACYQYWRGEAVPIDQRCICFTWVEKVYRTRFNAKLHQSALDRLTKLGYLEKDDTSRSGDRRYYKIPHPDRVGALLSGLFPD